MEANIKDKRIVNVSIVAANYNNGKYLAEFIDNIINSTVLPKELIIIDDGSNDDSLEILENYKRFNFLIIFAFPKNVGFTNALNKGLDLATGQYILRADPDDLLLSDKIEKQFVYMEEHPEIDILGSNALYFNDINNSIINKSNFPITDDAIKKTYKKGEHGILHATAIIKSEVFKQFRYKNISPAEDYELFSRMALGAFTFHNLKEPLYMVRVHQGSSTTNLKIESIRQTFEFRDQIFGLKTSKVWVFMYFKYIQHYRKYQISENIFIKYLHLLLSIFFYPTKLIKRIKN